MHEAGRQALEEMLGVWCLKRAIQICRSLSKYMITPTPLKAHISAVAHF